GPWHWASTGGAPRGVAVGHRPTAPPALLCPAGGSDPRQRAHHAARPAEPDRRQHGQQRARRGRLRRSRPGGRTRPQRAVGAGDPGHADRAHRGPGGVGPQRRGPGSPATERGGAGGRRAGEPPGAGDRL
ncbi:MAG: hypothetical protein AVDCRST_MAG49-2528, partial [uncultured Thermomicrobiales bacterium]